MRYFCAIIFFFSSFLYSQTNGTTDSVVHYNKLASLNIKEDKFKKALANTQKALNYSQGSSDIKLQADQTYKLGVIYLQVKKYNDAIVAFQKSSAFYKKSGPVISEVYCNYYICVAYIQLKNYHEAEHYLQNAKSKASQLSDAEMTTLSTLITLQSGIISKFKADYELASNLFKSIIAIPESKVQSDARTEALFHMGTIEAIKEKYNLALNYLNKALALSIKNKNQEQQANILLALSSVHDKMLDKNNAYSFLKQHLNLKESLSILNNKRLEIDDYDEFKESQRIKEIAQNKSKALQQEKSNKFSKLISILAIALISILSLLSLSLYKNNIIRNQSNLLLKEKNKELEIAKDKAEKASNARSDFLSTVSHELRTPLNAINGITHLLLEDNPKKSQMDYLSSLKFSGDYLAKFINEILEINKIDSDKFEIEYINFNLKKLLENIQNSLKELAVVNNNKFSLNIDSRIPDFLIGDPTKLSQIMLNLINNALKFTKNGAVNVLVDLKSLTDELATIHFEVTDTGIGIPEDKLKSVFDSFSQGSIEVNRKYGGTGLGLTIVKKIIQALGGEIELKSTVGKGSTFSFELQLMVGSEVSTSDENYVAYDDNNLKDKRVLLVEDNKINQMISAKMLHNKGLICTLIDNGEEAIETARLNSFDLVLMDVHLPGINGTVATEEIRKFDKVTPIIALTAISLDENREMLLSYGMNDVITKPFVPEEFYSTIAKYL